MSRRAAFLLCVAAAATAGGPAATTAPSGVRTAAATGAAPARWKPWLLSSPAQLRLRRPPSATSAQTKRELRQLLRLQPTRTSPAVAAAIAKWVAQPVVVPWVELELRMIQTARLTPAFAARALALLGAAMYDATIAADESRSFYARSTRPTPWRLDKRLKPAVKTAAGSTYASYEAAVAGAAERVLAYLFPAEPRRTFAQQADEAVDARLAAGLNYASDLQRARALGQKVGALAIARGRTDGHDNKGYSEGPFAGEQFWIGTPLSPSEVWEPTPPSEGTIGSAVATWKPWLLSDARALWSAVPAPSAYGSAPFMSQLDTVLATSRTLTDVQRQLANVWDDGPGTLTPAGHWEQIALQLIKANKVAGADALRIVAYLAIADHDAAISQFGLAFHHWKVRPITAIWRLHADGTLGTQAECNAQPSVCVYRDKWFPLLTTPQHPGYPAVHTTMAGVAARLLGSFFPKAAGSFDQFADQVASSRLYAGVDFPEDDQAGLALGRAVGDLFEARAQAGK